MTALSPLVFEPMLFEKVWGGRRLERLGINWFVRD